MLTVARILPTRNGNILRYQISNLFSNLARILPTRNGNHGMAALALTFLWHRHGSYLQGMETVLDKTPAFLLCKTARILPTRNGNLEKKFSMMLSPLARILPTRNGNPYFLRVYKNANNARILPTRNGNSIRY